jgi:DNA-binding response OmpR family regulator
MRGYAIQNGDISVEPLFANPPVMRVLVIDDDASVGAAVQMILVREGCDTVHAPDADAGIRAFESSRFDLVVVDLFMPGMDGLEIITEFRRRAPTLSILAMSGFRFRDSIDPGLDFLSLAANVGATICLRKPFSPHQLVAAIQASQTPALLGLDWQEKANQNRNGHHDAERFPR